MPNAPLRPKRAAVEGPQAAVFTPLYKQIKHMLVQELERGAWKPGELIPSEMELAARFKVSQGTVRKAVDELAAENLLVRRQGKGTFVATHQEPRAQFRFLRIVPDQGDPVPATSRFLECRRLRAPAEVARQLELKTGDAVVYIRRLLLFEQKPLIVDDIWLPGGTFRGLTAERLAEYRGPLYGLFESEFGTRMIRAAERLRARGAEPEIAELLEVAPGTPLLVVDRVSFTYGDRPVEVRRGHCLTEHHHYRNTLT
ncbi:MAG: GntR family transcriptional regulator [Sutterellaceae bacterium]|nr:GntR family transcriptional regulator [Burkholderiaceae bacterium]MCX7901916.1 GntR family transcriptional regulator [Burkholderiaceae bacterium]MDW8429908.1 GntR family transcriptional regulator [Sutterellaceae bacterium]